ncbi:hypothetical protein [Thalassobaculum sp.]
MVAPCVLLYARNLLEIDHLQWSAAVPKVLSGLALAWLDPRGWLGGTAW